MDGYNHEIISVTESGFMATSKLVIKKTQEGDFGKYQVNESKVIYLALIQEPGNHHLSILI